jgi:hypothetical protein
MELDDDKQPVRLASRPPVSSTFLRTKQRPATGQQYFFSQNKSAPAISHQSKASRDQSLRLQDNVAESKLLPPFSLVRGKFELHAHADAVDYDPHFHLGASKMFS